MDTSIDPRSIPFDPTSSDPLFSTPMMLRGKTEYLLHLHELIRSVMPEITICKSSAVGRTELMLQRIKPFTFEPPASAPIRPIQIAPITVTVRLPPADPIDPIDTPRTYVEGLVARVGQSY